MEPGASVFASAVIVEIPMPISAVSSSSPAATSNPKVITSTTAATPVPMTSVAPVSGTALSASPGGAGSPGVRRRGRGGPRCGFREVRASCAQGKRVEVHDAGVLHGVSAARLSRDLEGHRFTARYCP